MKKIPFKTKNPQGESNGKTLTLIGEFCQSWGLYRKIQDFVSLLVTPLSEKGYTVKYGAVPVPFRIPSDYTIYKVEDDKKIKVFSNKEEDEEKGIIVGHEIDEDNVEEVIKKIIE